NDAIVFCSCCRRHRSFSRDWSSDVCSSDLLAEGFELLEPLGEGAYAETYKARDTQSGALVLLKSPNPLLFADPAIHQRFMRESEIARHLNHPGVQRSVDLGENRSEPYLALEYIEGDNLRRWLRKHKLPLSVSQAVQWGRELAEALA